MNWPPDEPDGWSPLFDPDEGTRRRDEAIDRVEEHAHVDWNHEVDQAILKTARHHPFFTTDDVWAALLELPASTHEPRAMGAAMRRAYTAGWIRPVDRWELSKRPACHRRPVRIWQSLFVEAA